VSRTRKRRAMIIGSCSLPHCVQEHAPLQGRRHATFFPGAGTPLTAPDVKLRNPCSFPRSTPSIQSQPTNGRRVARAILRVPGLAGESTGRRKEAPTVRVLIRAAEWRRNHKLGDRTESSAQFTDRQLDRLDRAVRRSFASCACNCDCVAAGFDSKGPGPKAAPSPG